MTEHKALLEYEPISTEEVLRRIEDGDTVVLVVRKYSAAPDLYAIADTLTARRRAAAIARGDDPFKSNEAEVLKADRMVILPGIVGMLIVLSYRAIRAGAPRGYGADLLLLSEDVPQGVAYEAEPMTATDGIVRAAPPLDHAALVPLRVRPPTSVEATTIYSGAGTEVAKVPISNGSPNAEVYREDGSWVATFAVHADAQSFAQLFRTASGTELVIR